MNCAICLEPLTYSEPYCGHRMFSMQDGTQHTIDHFFHVHCFKNQYEPTCSLCRRRFTTEKQGLSLISCIEKNAIETFKSLLTDFIFPPVILKSAILAAQRSSNKEYLIFLVTSGLYSKQDLLELSKSD